MTMPCHAAPVPMQTSIIQGGRRDPGHGDVTARPSRLTPGARPARPPVRDALDSLPRPRVREGHAACSTARPVATDVPVLPGVPRSAPQPRVSAGPSIRADRGEPAVPQNEVSHETPGSARIRLWGGLRGAGPGGVWIWG